MASPRFSRAERPGSRMAKQKPKTKTKTKMKICIFRLDDKKIAFLDRWAKREGKTRSEILRSTLETKDRRDPDLIDRLTPATITLKDPQGPRRQEREEALWPCHSKRNHRASSPSESERHEVGLVSRPCPSLKRGRQRSWRDCPLIFHSGWRALERRNRTANPRRHDRALPPFPNPAGRAP